MVCGCETMQSTPDRLTKRGEIRKVTCRNCSISTENPKKNASTTAYHDQSDIIQDCRKANCFFACFQVTSREKKQSVERIKASSKASLCSLSNHQTREGYIEMGEKETITSPNAQRSYIPRITRPRLAETLPSSSFAPRPPPDLLCPKAPPFSALCRADSSRICRVRILGKDSRDLDGRSGIRDKSKSWSTESVQSWISV